MMSDNRHARLAGFLYLVLAVTGGFAELYVRTRVVVPGDAEATLDNIAASANLFRAGFAADLVNIVCFLGVALILYRLLKPVSERAALAMLVFNAVSVAILSLNLLNHLGALLVATGTQSAGGLGESAPAMVMLFVNLHSHGYVIAQVFFGLWPFPLGYMLYRSRCAPRALGVTVMVGALGYVADVAATFSSSSLGSSLTPVLVIPSVIAEVSLIAWLLAKGLDLTGGSTWRDGSPISTRHPDFQPGH